MKILILVLSYNESPYKDLMKAQQQSWDSIKTNRTETFYYYGGTDVITGIQRKGAAYSEFGFPITDEYYYMAGKFQMMLQYIFDLGLYYDFIFRTNSSSYINKEKLAEFAETLPKEKTYAGWTMEDTNFDGGLMVSGAGIWLSPDCATYLREEINPDEEIEEDVLIGRILRKNGITAIDDKSRVDVPSFFSVVPLNKYHYRCKTRDRMHDAANMRILHDKITLT